MNRIMIPTTASGVSPEDIRAANNLALMLEQNSELIQALAMPVDDDFIDRGRIDNRREREIREAALDQASVVHAALATRALLFGAVKMP